MNILELTGKVPNQGLPDIKETDILEIHMLLHEVKGT
jgi:hypothetical protein